MLCCLEKGPQATGIYVSKDIVKERKGRAREKGKGKPRARRRDEEKEEGSETRKDRNHDAVIGQE